MSSSRCDFELVFREQYLPVSRYVARRVPADAVQDVVAETFLASWRRHGELRGDPLPWLLGVARRTIANHRRADARRSALNDRLIGEHHEPVQDELDRDSRVLLALSTLSPRDREALMLIAWDGLDHRVAASVMGSSTPAFTVRLHRARRKLERALTADEEGRIVIPREARTTQ